MTLIARSAAVAPSAPSGSGTAVVAKEDSSDADVDRPTYGVADSVPLFTMLFCALQHVMVCIGGMFVEPLVVSDALCGSGDPAIRLYLVNAILVTSGIGGVLQSLVGVRLPVLLGPSFVYIPALAIFHQSYACPTYYGNGTLASGVQFAPAAPAANASAALAAEHEWQARMTVVQGSLAIASSVQLVLGLTGCIGVLARRCGPITIAPMMLLLAMSMVQLCVGYIDKGCTGPLMIAILLLFILYMNEIKIPIPRYDTQSKKITSVPLAVFKLFPYLLAILIILAVSVAFTDLGVFAAGSEARTDAKGDVLSAAGWFAVPYPGKWGRPSADVGLALCCVAGAFASAVESVGHYAAAARACAVDAPPAHAVNRGIAVEGLACLVNAFLGGGLGLTTMGQNTGIIAITRVCSRYVQATAGVLFVALGVCTKFGALLAALPDPMIGGMLTVSVAAIAGIGIASLQAADMRCARNQTIVGFAMFAGMIIPEYVERNPFIDVTKRDLSIGDTLLFALASLMQMNMFVGGAIALLLDNTVRGATNDQRGLPDGTKIKNDTAYDFGTSVSIAISFLPFVRYLPFMPKKRDEITAQ